MWLIPATLVASVSAVALGGCASTATDPSGSAAAIEGLAPSSGPVGQTVTVTGRGFLRDGNTVRFGPGYIKGVSSGDGRTLRFVVPEGLDLCAPATSPCPLAYPRVTPGRYAVALLGAGDESNSKDFTVTER